MTAIFAVWNRKGLAVAADTQMSITDSESEHTMWTDSTSKIRRLSGHNVIVAYAGSPNINGIPVLSVVDEWRETITAPLETTADYVGHFFNWLSDHPLPPEVSPSQSIYLRVDRILDSLIGDEDGSEIPTSESVLDALSGWMETEPPNLFAPWEMENIRNQLEESRDNRERHSLSSLLAVQPSLTTDQEADELFRLAMALEEILTDRFHVKFSDEGDHHLVRDYLAKYLLKYWDDELTETEMLFIGYGSKEWVPSEVAVRLASYGGRLPRAVFLEAENEDHVWYTAIAQQQQFDTFLLGISPSLREKLLEHYDEHEDTGIKDLLADQMADRIATMRSKIKFFAPEKLAYVARSFVEVERLGSFLMEDLPGVGGEIEVETLSR